MSPGPPAIEGFAAAIDADAIEEDVVALLDCCNYKSHFIIFLQKYFEFNISVNLKMIICYVMTHYNKSQHIIATHLITKQHIVCHDMI